MNKITIAGCGRVGESTAQILAEEELCREILLLDIHDGVPEGVALDIQQSASLLRFDTRVTGATDPAAMAGSDMVIVTAGASCPASPFSTGNTGSSPSPWVYRRYSMKTVWSKSSS